MENVMLSIYIATFNHERYITQAINSVLMQKTQYSYEVLIGEDCSTDRTRDVLKKLEPGLPDYFHIYYREHNMHQENPCNSADLRNRCMGKYIIALEGDDYWLDPYKIEKQISFLEEHKNCIAVSHKCTIVDEDSRATGEKYPECEEEYYTLNHFASGILPGQLTTVMYRNPKYLDKIETSILHRGLYPEDRIIYFFLAAHGDVYCMQESMSAYRLIRTGGSSYSANYKFDFKKMEYNNRELLLYTQNINNYQAEKYAEAYLVRNLFGSYKMGQCSLADVIREFCVVNHKARAILVWTKSKINRGLFHKKLFY